MTQTPIKLSFEEYLTYDDETDKRYELVNGELVEITPARGRHADIVDALNDTLKQGLNAWVEIGFPGTVL